MPGGSPLLLSGGRATTVGRSERLGGREREREREIVKYHVGMEQHSCIYYIMNTCTCTCMHMYQYYGIGNRFQWTHCHKCLLLDNRVLTTFTEIKEVEKMKQEYIH